MRVGGIETAKERSMRGREPASQVAEGGQRVTAGRAGQVSGRGVQEIEGQLGQPERVRDGGRSRTD